MPDVTDSDPKVFISYRRDDTAPYAGRLHDRIADAIGEANVFMDVDSISFGHDFIDAISEAVASCDVLLAVIDPDWARPDENGRRRLDDAQDFVRIELEAALERDVRVVPVLVERAAVPSIDQLPPSLAPLIRRQALHLSHDKFRLETQRLIEDLALLGSSLSAPKASPRKPDATGFAADSSSPSDIVAREARVPAPPPSLDASANTPDAPGVVVLLQEPMMFKLQVSMTTQHLIELDKRGFFETVTVDGTVVQKKVTLDATHKITLDDAGQRVTGFLSFESTWTGKLKNVLLEIGGSEVFAIPGVLTAATSASEADAPAAPDDQAIVDAGWYRDPTGRFELRYWDGSTWTEHVTRGGEQLVDPPIV